jgi:hypothetical protein
MPWITVVLEPPPGLAHYSGPVIERVLPLAQARAACARMGVHSDACAWKKGATCYVVIPTGGPVRDLGAYRRHEIAHCNGWDHEHGHVAGGRGGHAHGHNGHSGGASVGDIARANDRLSVEAQ